MNTEIIFINKQNKRFNVQTLKSIRIIEEEGKAPTATLSLDIQEYNNVYGFESCEIKRDGELIFKGKITSIKIDGNDLKIELQVPINTDISRAELSVGIIRKLKEDNPELFTPLQTLDFSCKGEVFQSDLLTPKDVISIEDNIIAPLKIEQNLDSPISEINLLVKGAWVSKREGNIGISTKIANRFKMAKINTLTPKKLINSWPQFGEKFSGRNRATKYYVGQSRLCERLLTSISEKSPANFQQNGE